MAANERESHANQKSGRAGKRCSPKSAFPSRWRWRADAKTLHQRQDYRRKFAHLSLVSAREVAQRFLREREFPETFHGLKTSIRDLDIVLLGGGWQIREARLRYIGAQNATHFHASDRETAR